MTAIKHYHEISTLQQLHDVVFVHSSHICRIFKVDGRGKVQPHHVACIVVLIVVEQLGQSAAVCFPHFLQSDIRIRSLMHLCINFLKQIVVNFEELNQNGHASVIRQERGFERILRRGFHFRERSSRKIGNVLEKEKSSRESGKHLNEEEKSVKEINHNV